MSLKHVTSILILALTLSACAGITSPPPIVVTENPPNNTPGPGVATAYPIIQTSIGSVPTQPAYPMPNTPQPVTPTALPSSYEPQPGDNRMARDPVSVDLSKSRLFVIASDPVQVSLELHGDLPDKHHLLRVVVSPPDAQNVINVEVYSVVPPGIVSLPTTEPFVATVPLGNYPSGQYTVQVNGEKLGQFDTTYAPQPGDDKLQGDTAFVDIATSSLVFSPGSPVQVSAVLSGNLPTPCHQLRLVVSQPDENNVIHVKAYSVVDPSLMCATVIQPFEVTIPLGTFSTGQYKVFVNDEGLDEFGIGYSPQSGDEKFTRDQVLLELDKSKLLTTTTKPVQASAVLIGTLPDPCHQLRVVVNRPDSNNVINLEAYSLSDGSRNCIAVIAPFQAVIPLGEFAQGHYTVKVNGELLAEFDG